MSTNRKVSSYAGCLSLGWVGVDIGFHTISNETNYIKKIIVSQIPISHSSSSSYKDFTTYICLFYLVSVFLLFFLLLRPWKLLLPCPLLSLWQTPYSYLSSWPCLSLSSPLLFKHSFTPCSSEASELYHHHHHSL